MRTKPNLKPDGEQPNLPFLDSGAIPEFDELFTSLDDVDDLLREVGNLPGRDELLAETPSREQDRASLLLSPEERTASELLGAYATRTPARRCHRPRRREA